MNTKKLLAVGLIACALCGSASALDNFGSNRSCSASEASISPQVCVFSLTSYSGTINSGTTSTFKVGLSCPQDKDARATVTVYIDGEEVASKVVVIKAGKDYSESEAILVGAAYNGKPYKLNVL